MSNSTAIIMGFLLSTDMTRISKRRKLIHTELNTNHCSLPCAFARQKMNPVKKIKRQIKCLWVTPQRPCWTLVNKQTKRKKRKTLLCFLRHFWRPILFNCEGTNIEQSHLNGVASKGIWTMLLLQYEYGLWGSNPDCQLHLKGFLFEKKRWRSSYNERLKTAEQNTFLLERHQHVKYEINQ